MKIYNQKLYCLRAVVLCFPCRRHLASVDACLVFEHVTQQLLHGCAANGPVKEQLLYFPRAHKVKGWQQK